MRIRTRKSSTARRQEISGAVLEILGERGLSALTTDAVAAKVGLSSGAVFRHFASRDEILVEAVEAGCRRIEAVFPAEEGPALERLLAVARERVRLLGSEAGLAWLVRSDEARLALPPRAVERLQGLVADSRAFLERALEDGRREGTIRTDIPRASQLIVVMGTIQALIGLSGMHGKGVGTDSAPVDRVLEHLVRLLTPPQEADDTQASAPEKGPRRRRT